MFTSIHLVTSGCDTTVKLAQREQRIRQQLTLAMVFCIRLEKK